ncbi:hypothetical protein J437_LFUL015427 [Ladona fulva]|uniref:Uncharacterized protein n=1 Tax=Ladona fulva TaxID=123851 RepID=A0A8K0KPQ2_LADFU|nr:hypothetical protein J437_LFUL015427 [Ladona fulva]
MENSAFVPNPIPPPALVVFSQAGGLPEALRMQRPFNPQETKDLHVPFATSGFGIRHVDGYPGLPAHLLHHLQPRFLHPALDPHTPFGSGAFRPLGPAASDTKGFPSAFAPPSKCSEIESGGGRHETSPRRQPPSRQQQGPPAAHLSSIFSPSDERPFSEGRASPGVASPVVKEESMEAQEEREAASPGSEGTERSTPEEGRGFRQWKRRSFRRRFVLLQGKWINEPEKSFREYLRVRVDLMEYHKNEVRGRVDCDSGERSSYPRSSIPL